MKLPGRHFVLLAADAVALLVVIRRTLSDTPGALADRRLPQRSNRCCRLDYWPLAVGAFRSAVNRAGSGRNVAVAATIHHRQMAARLFVASNNAISTSLYKKLPYKLIADETEKWRKVVEFDVVSGE
jgi:hypothetical protein